MLAAALAGWRQLRSFSLELDAINAAQGDAQRLSQWLHARSRLGVQLAVGLGGVAFAVVTLRYVEDRIAALLEFSLMSYVAVAYFAFLGANVLYWLITISEIPIRLRSADLELTWYDPANTRVIVAMCDMYTVAAIATFIGLVGLEILALLVPGQAAHPEIRALSVGLPVLAGLLATWTGAQPFLTIHRIVLNFRRRKMHELQTHMSSGLWIGDATPNVILSRYQILREAPTLPINTATVVQYAAALLAVVVTFLLTRILGTA